MASARNRPVYPMLGLVVCAVFIYMSFGDLWLDYKVEPEMGFVKRNGTQFVVDDKVMYVNGWNSYWLMDHAVNEHSRYRVGAMLEAGAKMGLTVCRTWAFNDGGYNALQISPGRFDERVFKALDHVIAEAKKHRIRLLLSMVNNLQAYGGKTQYVKWAWQEGVGLSSSNDSFFFDPSIRRYFKQYITTLLTRKNSVTGIEYRHDPTIFAWELINEPRCISDVSGDTLQEWIEEMSGFVKSMDSKHLVTVGLEGFYGPNNPKGLSINPERWASQLGSDFVRNSASRFIDFASVHIYPDHWFHDKGFEEKMKYVKKWMMSHIEDGERELKKPILFAEFGLSKLNKDYEESQRDSFYRIIYDVVYESAAKGHGAGAGTLVWQLVVEGMDGFNDEFGVIPWQSPSLYALIVQQSCRLARLTGHHPLDIKFRQLCSL